MSVAHAIGRAWVSTGGTGAQNYDEFASDGEITDIVTANPASSLAIEMPHRTPEAVAAGWSFSDSLPAAAERLAAQQRDGRYAESEEIVGIYRISGDTAEGGRETAFGVFCMIDTDQISTSADEPGLVIRNEDVFLEKVRERTALTTQLGHLISPVLLLQTARGAELHAELQELTDRLGEPAVRDTDQQGRTHEVWALPAGEDQERVLALAGGGELIVADGNHRSLAAQVGKLPRFLAVVTTPASVVIRPYHRLIGESPVPAGELADRLRAAGAEVTELGAGPVGVPDGGTVHLYAAGTGYAVRLPAPEGGTVVDRLDYTVVEQLLLGGVLGLDPGDKRVTYVGGDYPAEWLCGEVDAGRSALAVLLAPVTVEDFVAVNLARLKMPRKSTWFTPKARGGLVLAQLSGEPA
jgi:uncharacterized protein (DUF1015 family)